MNGPDLLRHTEEPPLVDTEELEPSTLKVAQKQRSLSLTKRHSPLRQVWPYLNIA